MSKELVQQNNIQASFDLTLTDSNLESINIDVAEIAIDSVLNDGLLKDLPIVGTLVSLSKLGANIHDKLFLKKILLFLYGLKDISAEDRNKIIKEIDESKEYRIKVGEKLLYIIDKSDDYETSELVSKVFKYFIEGNISYGEFLKTSTVLNNITINDFKWFIKEARRYDLSKIGDLINTGLFEIYYDDITVDVREEVEYKRSNATKEKRYDTDVDGGIGVTLSRAGKIILEIFCPSYQKPKKIVI